MSASVALLPDAGLLITLAYADALDLLFKPGWPIVLVDMVLMKSHVITHPPVKSWADALKPTKCRYARPAHSSTTSRRWQPRT